MGLRAQLLLFIFNQKSLTSSSPLPTKIRNSGDSSSGEVVSVETIKVISDSVQVFPFLHFFSSSIPRIQIQCDYSFTLDNCLFSAFLFCLFQTKIKVVYFRFFF